jgi:phenylacetyl-CoA:acceptor oxidoreductase subunit 1
MARWGMVIDLRKCIGCEMCSNVCLEMNRNPVGANWRQVIDRKIEENPDLIRLFVPMNCMHCSAPPCLDVCPSGATYQRDDGIVEIKNELCIGCGYCVVACPYLARTISFEDKVQFELREGLQNPAVVKPDRIGICTKCNFCLKRIEDGLAKGLKPGTDPDVGPICVKFCIAGALFFGDLDDPESKVSQLIREHETVCLQEELGTKPSVYYIIK